MVGFSEGKDIVLDIRCYFYGFLKGGFLEFYYFEKGWFKKFLGINRRRYYVLIMIFVFYLLFLSVFLCIFVIFFVDDS